MGQKADTPLVTQTFSLWDLVLELDTRRCRTVVQKTRLVKTYSEKGEGKENKFATRSIKENFLE